MEHSKNSNHFRHSNRAQESVEFGHTSQGYTVDPIGHTNSNVRPSEPNLAEAKPVHNHFIHTGEEFLLEKTRDRGNLKKPLVQSAGGEPSLTTGSSELKGVRGISHTGPQTGSNTSMLAVVGKETKEFESKNSSSYEEKSNYGSVESVSSNSSGYNRSQTITNDEIRILCSFGGKILHRPQDGQLRYVGGETLSIRIRKDISWEELWLKTKSTYTHTHKIKYQLPGEDLDTLVSVSSDEALRNMMEDCNVFGDEEGSKKIRMFLFSVNDLNDTKFGSTSSASDSEVKYVVADNEMNIGVKGGATLHGLTRSSATNMDEPDVQNVARDKSRVASVIAAPSINQYSQPILSKSSNAHETQSQSHSHQGQLHREDAEKSLHPVFKPHTLSFYTPGGNRTLPLPSSAMVIREGGLSQDQPSGALVGSPDMIKQEVKVKVRSDDPSNQETEHELIRSMGKYADCLPVKEASAIMPALGRDPSRSSKNEGSPMRDHKSSDNKLFTSNSAIASKHIISQTDLIDFSYHEPPLPPLPPQSLFLSERYTPEKGESLNRLTKSDDLGSHFLVSHTRSSITQQDSVEESGKKLNNVDPAAKIEQCVSSAKLSKHGISDSGLLKFQNTNSSTETHLNDGDNKRDNQVLKPGDKTSFIKGNMNSSAIDETTGGNYNNDPASCLPNYTWLDRSASDNTSNYSPGKSQSSDRTGKAASFENSSGISLQKDVAHGQFSQKDVSLIDQDHIDFSSRLPKVEEKSEAKKLTPLVRGEISSNQISSKNKFGVQKESPGVSDLSTTALHVGYAPVLVEGKDTIQFKESSENIRIPESEYKDGIRSSHPLKPSSDNFDISSMQVIKNDDLEEIKKLGSGTFGTVYYGKWRGSDVAIKKIKKSCFAEGSSLKIEKMTEDFFREAKILSELHHPNVVAFYGVVQGGSGGTILATVAEYMVDGSLRHALLHKDRHLDHQKKLTIAMGAAFGMEYLHSKNIVHCDLKCDNLLVDLNDPARPKCKVADFGLSKIKRNAMVSGTLKGTLPWMAPEMLNNSGKNVSDKVDVFSFGIVLWEILTGEEPYAHITNDAELMGGIIKNTLRPAIPSSCDPEWKKLMEQCWDPDPMVRPTFIEIASRLRIMDAAYQTGAHVHKAYN